MLAPAPATEPWLPLSQLASVTTAGRGEPISAHGKTVVPVAKVAYGFGGGFGPGKHGAQADRQGEGGGGGGGVRAYPAGALEITDTGTRFVPFTDLRWLLVAFAAGAVLTSLLRVQRR